MSDEEDVFAELEREIAQATRHGTWPAYIVRALWALPDCTEKQDALAAIKSDCERRKRAIPRTFSDTVQGSFEAHNSGSENFIRRRTPRNADLFFFAGVKGDGKWGLHVERAKAWMARNGYDLG